MGRTRVRTPWLIITTSVSCADLELSTIIGRLFHHFDGGWQVTVKYLLVPVTRLQARSSAGVIGLHAEGPGWESSIVAFGEIVALVFSHNCAKFPWPNGSCDRPTFVTQTCRTV